MRTQAQRRERFLDLMGISASLACAVHCSVLPILLAYSAFGGLAWMGSHSVEIAFISIACLVAVPAFVKGYRKHGNLYPSAAALLGFTLIFASLMNHNHAENTPLLLPTIAGLTIAFAHLYNLKLTSFVSSGSKES